MSDYDAIIVGAGFAGIYQLHTLRSQGLKCLVIDQAGDVGGTWYWNLYPGAMSDTESYVYRFSWDKEDLQSYPWPEHYVKQPEVLAYLRHVAQKHDLRRDMQFNTELRGANWNKATSTWDLALSDVDSGHSSSLKCKYLITALGLLSAKNFPPIPGLDTFSGVKHHTAAWPSDIDLTGKRVGVVGCGSTGVQVITDIAGKVGHLTCFQRHPQYSVPSGDRPVTDDYRKWVNEDYEEVWERVKNSVTAFGFEESTMFGTFSDIATNRTANEAACTFIRRKIATLVTDPAKAAALSPHDIYARRPLCDGQARGGPHEKGGYYAQFNRPNVEIVTLLTNPIERIESRGVRTGDGKLHELDVLIFATGFDAVEGNYTRLSIRGREDRSLGDVWGCEGGGPSSFLGVAVPEFPNMFLITGPKGPFTNIPPAIEAQVEFVGKIMAEADGRVVDVSAEAEKSWSEECEEAAKGSLFWEAEDNWIFGANVAGKPRTLRFFFGGMKKYRERLLRCQEESFAGFEFFGVPSGT